MVSWCKLFLLRKPFAFCVPLLQARSTLMSTGTSTSNSIGNKYLPPAVLGYKVFDTFENNDNCNESIYDTRTIMNMERYTIAQLRKAAGSQSIDQLKVALNGWTCHEVDTYDDNAPGGKNPLHMAAWKGCIENVKYLIENIGCNINQISTGTFSYGKTPLFFALTRSREDIVEYLLGKGACVKIVNNKGQSILSIAASHVSQRLIDKIIQMEQNQSQITWTNYRKTHSDNLQYDDLDPRFIEREIVDSDVVCELVINPTTCQSRKGNFMRRNPTLALSRKKVEEVDKNHQTIVSKTGTSNETILSEADKKILKDAWIALQESFHIQDREHAVVSLQEIIRINDQLRTEWIPEIVKQYQCISQNNIQFCMELLLLAKESCTTNREENLIEKIRYLMEDPDKYRKRSSTRVERSQRQQGSTPCLSDSVWKDACHIVQDLRISKLERPAYSTILSLPVPPIFVNTIPELEQVIVKVTKQELVAIDTEWHSNDLVSTLQIAFMNDETYVIDLLESSPSTQQACTTKQATERTKYKETCRHLIQLLFDEKIVLGFALNKDIQKLEQYMNSSTNDDSCTTIVGISNNPTPYNNNNNNNTNMESRTNHRILDYQKLFHTESQMPGLASCASFFSTMPLCKKQQCSNWSIRPLSTEQLEYAGLDAAVLLYLLSEKKRQVVEEEVVDRNSEQQS